MPQFIAMLDPDNDFMTIQEAEEQMFQTESARKKESDEAKAKLRGQTHFCQ
jgi:hypothetical protein